MLKAVIGLGDSIENAILSALKEYNKEDSTEQKTFHHADIHERFIKVIDEVEYLCVIWYTARKTQYVQQGPEYKYISSEGVDPNDPDWLTKWQEIQKQPSLIAPLNVQSIDDEEWTDADTDWRLNTDDFDNTDETSPDGSGSTEPESPYVNDE